ncbi:MAG: FixG Ig-like domain-containing protein, partial [Acidobacteriaceae bacterium]
TDATPMLGPGESATFQVMVSIPADALDGDQDEVMLEAAFHSKPSHMESAMLTTNVGTVFAFELTPTTAARAGNSGETVDYTLHITNQGNTADTYEFSVSGNAWTVEFSVPSVTLEAGESEDVVVSVTIPGDATVGSSDTAVFHVTSQGKPTVIAQSTLTTSVGGVKLFLPVIAKD